MELAWATGTNQVVRTPTQHRCSTVVACTITHGDKEQLILEAAFPEPPVDKEIAAPLGGSAHEAIDRNLVGRILSGCSNQSAPGEDRMGAEVVKLLWEWDPERITNLVRACIKAGTHPKEWKTAKGIVIPKPGKPDYRQVRAHRVKKTAAHLISDQLERSRGLHDGQYGFRRRRSCVDAVAILMETGIPQGSPVSPILFTVYLSGLFGYVEEQVPGIKALSFVDDVAWTTEGDSEDEISLTLERAAAAAQEWVEANAVSFDTEKTEAILLSRRRKHKGPSPPPGESKWQGAQSISTRRPPGGSARGSTRS